MAKVESLYRTTLAEILESGLENIDEIEAVVATVLWKDGCVTAGWSALSDKPEPARKGCRSEALRPPADAIRPAQRSGSS
ncbi:MAG: hypothetical protein GY791_13505 [Alphaproteobacteria bacterium]|nr:hypothetical protein [Alphaproteobacteria bacterium]